MSACLYAQCNGLYAAIDYVLFAKDKPRINFLESKLDCSICVGCMPLGGGLCMRPPARHACPDKLSE